MIKQIKMITFDLDDTLWDNYPTIMKAEVDTREWIENKVGEVEWGDFNDFINLHWFKKNSFSKVSSEQMLSRF